MSKELIDEFIDLITESEQDDFPSILNELMRYGFIDDIQLAELLELDLEDLDDLLDSADHLTDKEWKAYCNKLKKYLTKEKAKYARLYYRAKP